MSASKENAPGYVEPFVPATSSFPEITLKAFILSIILTILMAGANAYLGLKIGMTVSATIPAAVISMAVLRFFKKSNILENNIVQTAASAGEAAASAVVFTLPALLLMGYWTEIPFVTTAAIVIVGGLLGVLFTIPLRRAFVVESDLKFPEGVATGEVLKCGDSKAKGTAADLLRGGLVAAVIKLFQSGFHLVEDAVGFWVKKGKVVFGAQTGFDLVLVGAGYIIGIEVVSFIFLAALLAWGIGVPLYSYLYGTPENLDAYGAAIYVWSEQIRFIGIGIMVVGGFWTVIKLIDPLKKAIQFSFATLKKTGEHALSKQLRTEHDIPMPYVLAGVVALLFPLAYIFHDMLSCCNFGLDTGWHFTVVFVLTVFVLIFGFMVSALGGYLAGLVGSSNSPLSAVVIMSIISVAIILMVMIGEHLNVPHDAQKILAASAMTIMLSSVMANASTISIDNLQDLKSGQIVGATPWKQQVMLIVGVLVGAFVITEILSILYQAYGFGTSLPRADMDPAEMLPAPTASVMNKITHAVFTGAMNWPMFSIGAGVAVFLIVIDLWLKRKGSRISVPPLAFAIGIYLPLGIIFPLVLGGVIDYLSKRSLDRKRVLVGAGFEERADQARKRGLLFASGLIAGEALMGIALAVPFAAAQNTKIFSIRPENFNTMAMVLGAVLFFGVAFYLKHISSKLPKIEKE